jgi:hypothetical protein
MLLLGTEADLIGAWEGPGETFYGIERVAP